ncbi:MAG: EAL domain-containing protein [Arthrobacter sp.]
MTSTHPQERPVPDSSSADDTAHLLASAAHRLRVLEGTITDLVFDAPVEELLDRIAAKAGEALRTAGHLLAVRLPSGGRHLRAVGNVAGLVDSLGDDGVSLGDGLSAAGLDVLTAPVTSKGQCYGVLAAVGPQGDWFSPEDATTLAAYACHAAATLNIEANAVDAREHAHSARLLLKLAQTLTQQSTVGSVAASIAEAIPGLVSADRSGVMAWDQESNKIRVSGMSGWRGELAQRFAVHAANVADSPELTEIMGQGKPMLVDRSGSTWAKGILDEFDLSAFVAAPIIAGNGLSGLVVACWTETGPGSLNAVIAERLTGLAGLAAVALYNVRLLEDTRHQALHDSMTGLPNRALLEDRLEAALARAGRTGRHVGILFCDVNRFKRINDSLGHAAGDAALRHIAAQLKSAVRRDDTVARYSGDEFVILLPDIESQREVEQVAARVSESLVPGLKVNGREIFVDVAIGSSISGAPRPGEATEPLSRTAQRLIEQADVEMYRTKARANRAATPDFTAENTLQLESDLHGAAVRGELRVLYQPQIDVAARTVVGAEALVRWEHPQLGLLSPGEFIPLAEASTLILEVGSHVLEESCRAGAALHDKGHRLDISVNVSPVQLGHPDFPSVVTDILTRTGFPAGALTLEITESQAVSGSQINQQNLHDLRTLGVDVSVDDFGTGYSSLAQLHRLPVTEVKIDQSFTGRLADGDDASAAFVAAIIGLCNGLRLRVVAEGVETAEQLNALRAMGCDRAQGYLLGKPGDVATLEDLIRADEERRDAPARERLVPQSGAVRWTLLRDTPGTLADITGAARALGFETEAATETEIRVHVPGAILKRRRHTTLVGVLTPTARGTEVYWAASADSPDEGHLLALEERLPEGVMYYHGLRAAAERAGLPKPGAEDLRGMVGLLGREESARALGLGHLDGQEGYVILTGQRLLMVATVPRRSKPLLDVRLDSVERLSMGKRRTGETIRFVAAGQTTEISRLGHGEAYEIAQLFRDTVSDRARHEAPRGARP